MFKSISEIQKQLNTTKNDINNFKDEVVGDDLTRYNNVDEHLNNLKQSLDNGTQALMALQNFGLEAHPNLNPLVEAVNQAIIEIEDRLHQDTSGALVEALSAINTFEAAIQDFFEEGNYDEN